MQELSEFIRGDMYIRDQRNTKGHVSGCTSGQWHPTDRKACLTASEDGTLRLWDTEVGEQATVIKPQLAKPGRVAVTAAQYSSDGNAIAGGLMNGSIHIFDARGKIGRSAAVGAVAAPRQQMVPKQTWSYVAGSGQVVKQGHLADSEITSLCFARDSPVLLSRCTDNTLKVGFRTNADI